MVFGAMILIRASCCILGIDLTVVYKILGLTHTTWSADVAWAFFGRYFLGVA